MPQFQKNIRTTEKTTQVFILLTKDIPKLMKFKKESRNYK